MVWKMNSSIDWHKVAVYLFAITCPEVMIRTIRALLWDITKLNDRNMISRDDGIGDYMTKI